MVDVDKAVVAKYERKGKKFEILVDPELAWKLRRGENVRIDDMLASFDVYRDVRTGERVSEEELQEVFGTTNVYEIAEIIVKQGDVPLTTEQRRRMLEERRMQIATIIAKRAINPQTNTPHPVQRILNAMEQAKVHIDPLKPAEEQIEAVVSAIRKIIPIRLETKKIELVIPPQYTGKLYGKIRAYKVIREDWRNDGSLRVVIEVPAGVTEEVLHEFASLTHGNIQSRMVE